MLIYYNEQIRCNPIRTNEVNVGNFSETIREYRDFRGVKNFGTPAKTVGLLSKEDYVIGADGFPVVMENTGKGTQTRFLYDRWTNEQGHSGYFIFKKFLRKFPLTGRLFS